MATRTYYRDSKGRFHGSAGGRVTFGKAGGFQKGHASFGGAARGAARSSMKAARAVTRSLTRGYSLKGSYVKSTRTVTGALLRDRRVVKVVSVRIPGGRKKK